MSELFAGYRLSTNYGELFELAKRQVIVCINQHNVLGCTRFEPWENHYGNDQHYAKDGVKTGMIYQIDGDIGFHILTETKEDFIRECKSYGLRWIVPQIKNVPGYPLYQEPIDWEKEAELLRAEQEGLTEPLVKETQQDRSGISAQGKQIQFRQREGFQKGQMIESLVGPNVPCTCDMTVESIRESFHQTAAREIPKAKKFLLSTFEQLEKDLLIGEFGGGKSTYHLREDLTLLLNDWFSRHPNITVETLKQFFIEYFAMQDYSVARVFVGVFDYMDTIEKKLSTLGTKRPMSREEFAQKINDIVKEHQMPVVTAKEVSHKPQE